MIFWGFLGLISLPRDLRLSRIASQLHIATTVIIRGDPPFGDLNDLSIHGGAFKKVVLSSEKSPEPAMVINEDSGSSRTNSKSKKRRRGTGSLKSVPEKPRSLQREKSSPYVSGPTEPEDSEDIRTFNNENWAPKLNILEFPRPRKGC